MVTQDPTQGSEHTQVILSTREWESIGRKLRKHLESNEKEELDLTKEEKTDLLGAILKEIG